MKITEIFENAERIFGGKIALLFFLIDCTLLVALVPALLSKRKKEPPVERVVIPDLPDRDKTFLKDKLRTTLRESEPNEVYSAQENGVETEYAKSLLKALRALPLTAGDRLETDALATKIETLSDKDGLTATETRALNDGYSALLKMVAKYSL